MGTIIQELHYIESKIYTIPYDSLTPYLQGIRDMMNLVNGEEPAGDIADSILEKITRLENYYE